MYRRIMIPILLVMALFCISYGIYRSTAERITVVENGQEVVYGEPQHGLILGLFVFSGLCVLGAVNLLTHKEERITTDANPLPKKNTFIS